MEVIKRHLADMVVSDARHLTSVRDGVKVDTTCVVLSFSIPVLPPKVFLGYQAFPVREYIPPPLRCYKCQRFGHTATSCRGKRRCSKCNGDHEYESCTCVKMCCANCGGEHSAAYRGCVEFQRAAQIQQVKTTGKLSYAEAVLKVPKVVLPVKETNRITKTPAPVKIQTVSVGCQTETIDQDCQTEDSSAMVVLNISKLGFIGFITEVVNCTAVVQRRSEKISIIASAACKHLGWDGISTKDINKIFNKTGNKKERETSPDAKQSQDPM